MGCDIHIKIEQRGTNGAWECIAVDYFQRDLKWNDVRLDKPRYQDELYECIDAARDRNYRLFSLLSNVRSREGAAEVLFEDRGMPKDASKSVRLSGEEVDWHSHTHFTVREAVEYLAKISAVSSEFAELIRRLAFMSPDPDGTRIVIWYDS